MAEEDAQSLGEGEDELSVGKGEQEVVGEVVGEQEGTLLRAGGAEMEALAGKGDEEIVTTFGIGTLDAGHAPEVVAAAQEPLCNLCDSWEAVETELFGKEGVVLGGEL